MFRRVSRAVMVLPWRKRVAFVDGGRAEGLVRSVDGEREKVTATAEAKDGRSTDTSQMVEESIMLTGQIVVFPGR